MFAIFSAQQKYKLIFYKTNILLFFQRGFLMWAVQSPGRRLRPQVSGWLHHIEYGYTSGLHCFAMRTAHIKNPDWGERSGVWLRNITFTGVIAALNTCLQFKINPLCGLTPYYSLREL